MSDDLISRSEAIDALEREKVYCTVRDGYTQINVFDKYNAGLTDGIKALKNLPSAQPKISCDGCRYVGTYDTDFPCSGCIRREKDYYEQER